MRVQQEKTSQLSAPNMPGLQGTSVDLAKYTKSEKKCIEMYWKLSKATEFNRTHGGYRKRPRCMKRPNVRGGKSDVLAWVLVTVQ